MIRLPHHFVAFDLETTGLKPPGSRIIEIGAVKVVDGVIADTWQRMVNPGCRIPPMITDLTGITDAMVRDALPVEMVLPAFLDFVGDLPLAAHNIRFDMSFIAHDARCMGLTVPNEQIDTVPLARRCFPSLPNHKLGTVARHLGVLGDAEHRGLEDATVVARILLHALDTRVGTGGTHVHP